MEVGSGICIEDVSSTDDVMMVSVDSTDDVGVSLMVSVSSTDDAGVSLMVSVDSTEDVDGVSSTMEVGSGICIEDVDSTDDAGMSLMVSVDSTGNDDELTNNVVGVSSMIDERISVLKVILVVSTISDGVSSINDVVAKSVVVITTSTIEVEGVGTG